MFLNQCNKLTLRLKLRLRQKTAQNRIYKKNTKRQKRKRKRAPEEKRLRLGKPSGRPRRSGSAKSESDTAKYEPLCGTGTARRWTRDSAQSLRSRAVLVTVQRDREWCLQVQLITRCLQIILI